MDPTPIVDALGGVATRQQLLARGCSGFDLTVAVKRGSIRRIRQARYVSSAASPDAVMAARVGGMLAGLSAARSYGLWAGFDPRLHISVAPNASRLRTHLRPSLKPTPLMPDRFEREIVLHWVERGGVDELGPECWRVPLSMCLRQVVEWCDRETALATLDTALTEFQLRPSELALRVEPSAAVDKVLSLVRSGSESGVESVVRQRLESAGLDVEQQFEVDGVGRFDMRIKGTRLLIEVDSRAFHDSDPTFERDRWRNAEALLRGWTVVRLTYRRVFEDWDWCLDTIRRLSSFRSHAHQ